ncbi:hypothetical protein LDK20_00770 [Fusobacterium nucleatum]|uniref:hypothetical protein n=1 Tax=Fusobacterium nucleatum TaxID=851 RepID=UPI0030D140FB
MEEKTCKNCGKSMEIEDSYDTCENCRTKDIESKRNRAIALMVILAIGSKIVLKFINKGKSE